MQFRYKLAKETFKNKKIPVKNDLGEDHVAEDQRGNHTVARRPRRESSLLNLGREIVTSSPGDKAEAKEVSRRDLFGFAKFTDYAEKLDTEKQKSAKKAKQKPQQTADAIPTATVDSPPEVEAETRKETPGTLRTIWLNIKSLFKKSPVPIVPKISAEIKPAAPQPIASDAVSIDAAPPTSPVAEIPAKEAQKTKIKEPEKRNPLFPPLGELFTPLDEDEPDPDDKEVSRRNLFRSSIHYLAKPAMESIQEKIENVNTALDKVTRRVPLLRPPGAISERHFLKACTHCDACIHACPKDAIRKAPKSMGYLIMGTPYIDPVKTPCVMCDGLPCISACKDEALLPVASPADVRMGYAILDKEKCQAYGDTFCQQCVIDCPIPGAITQKDMKPVIHKNVCTGCGVCVRSCKTVNTLLAIKIKPQMVIESHLRKKLIEQKKQERTEKPTSGTNNDGENAPGNAESASDFHNMN